MTATKEQLLQEYVQLEDNIDEASVAPTWALADWISEHTARVDHRQRSSHLRALSDEQETEALRLVEGGRTSREIASSLNVTLNAIIQLRKRAKLESENSPPIEGVTIKELAALRRRSTAILYSLRGAADRFPADVRNPNVSPHTHTSAFQTFGSVEKAMEAIENGFRKNHTYSESLDEEEIERRAERLAEEKLRALMNGDGESDEPVDEELLEEEPEVEEVEEEPEAEEEPPEPEPETDEQRKAREAKEQAERDRLEKVLQQRREREESERAKKEREREYKEQKDKERKSKSGMRFMAATGTLLYLRRRLKASLRSDIEGVDFPDEERELLLHEIGKLEEITDLWKLALSDPNIDWDAELAKLGDE